MGRAVRQYYSDLQSPIPVAKERVMSELQKAVIVGSREIGGNHEKSINDYTWRFLAQGDSWFSLGASLAVPPDVLPPNGSVLFWFKLPDSSIIVNSAYPGKTLEKMVDPDWEVHFKRLISGRFAHEFDAIFLSAGGNDFINAIGIDPATGDENLKPRRLLKTKDQWSGQGPERYVDADGWKRFTDRLTGYYDTLLQWRDRGDGDGKTPNRGIPIFTHSYDYATPRDAPVFVGPKKFGTWLWEPFNRHQIPPEDHIGLVHYFLVEMHVFQSQLNDALVARGNAVEYPNILAVDFHGALKPAAAAKNGEDASWENEIHPTSDGYATLAEKFGAEVVSRLRRARIV
jgi:hypothetical protein